MGSKPTYEELQNRIRELERVEFERERYEKELRASKARIRSIFQAAPIGIGVVSNRIFQDVNDRFCELSGYSREELIGQNARIVYPTNKDYEFVGQEKYSQIEKHGTGTVQTRFQRKDGEIIDVLVSSTPCNTDDLPSGVVFTAMDITERRRAEESMQLAQMQLTLKVRQLEQKNLELEEFAYAISHDLKAPLRAINNYSAFLYEDLAESLSDEDKQYLEGLNVAATQGQRLLDDLLAFSRVGRSAIETERVDIPTMISEVKSFLNLSPDIEVTVQEDWPVLHTAPLLLSQILKNLIANAVKFNRSAIKRIEIGWQTVPDERIEIFVRDNGIGIEQEYLDQIFRIFRRLHTSKEYEGTGIGLAIVKKAALQLGAEVRVASRPGEGSTFYINLPNSILEAV